MKGSKEWKGDRSSMQASGGSGVGGGSVTETGALFPRLQVKETKRVGPRAPPRNKMALYEHFTCPSNRYVPPSAAKTATSYGPQQSSYDGSMFYAPSPAFGAMPWMPWMPYSEVRTGSYFGWQPSINGSSSSTVVDCEGEVGQGADVPTSDSGRFSVNAASHIGPWVSSHSNVESVSSKKARNNNDRTVPTYTPPVASCRGPPTPAVRSNHIAARAGHQDKVDTGSTPEPISVFSGLHWEASGLATSRTNGGIRPSRWGSPGGNTAEQFRKGRNKYPRNEDESELLESTIVEKEKDSMEPQKSHAEHSDSHYSVVQSVDSQNQRKGSHAGVFSDVAVLKGRDSSGECLTGIDEDSTVQPSRVGLKARSTHAESQAIASALSNTTAGETNHTEDIGQDVGGQGSKEHSHESDHKSISSAGSDDELEITSGSAEVSDVSQSDEGLSDRSESVAGDAFEAETDRGRAGHNIAPKDIVDVIGEQEFWRARKLILRYRGTEVDMYSLSHRGIGCSGDWRRHEGSRQQKIFSAQVFELHRIVKVQQLLASSPLTEEIITSPGEEPAEVSEPAQANRSPDAEKTSKSIEALGRNQERQEDMAGKQPDSSGHSSTSDRMCDDPPVGNSETGHSEAGQVPPLLNVTPGASSASWGGQPYAKAGANNWFGAVPAPNGAYVYQPYPGSFHASHVNNMGGYNGAYPVMCAPSAMELPPMTPYGVPMYEQQPNLVQDMYRYNSYHQQQWPSAVFCPPLPSNPGPSWCGVPQPLPFMNPAMKGPYGWCNELAGGSHPCAPSNYMRASPQNGSQPMPPAFHPSYGMHSPWADASNNAGVEAEKFQPQGHWSSSLETGQTATPVFQIPRVYSSDQDCAQVGSQNDHGGGTFGECDTSAAPSRQPMRDSTSQDCEVSASQHAETGGHSGWRCYDRNHPRDSCADQAEVFAADQHRYAETSENVLKRSRGSRLEPEGLGEKNGARQSFESRASPDSQMDALPLFPLGPASKGFEIGRPRNHSSSGVIKAVPRAVVASAESTAGILSSIQSQRQQ